MVESTQEKPIVVITGISGYIGMHVLQQFLQDGSFRVRGTVRGKTEDKLRPIRNGVGAELFDKLEVVEADLLNAYSLNNACEGATYVVHTASPFPLKNPKTADELVRPAVEGTTAIVKACHAAKVKRLVITSSVASIMNCRDENRPATFTEEHWSDVEHMRTTN